MSMIPLLLPLKANEAATVAQLEQIGIATRGRFHYRMQGNEEAIRLAASSLLGKTI